MSGYALSFDFMTVFSLMLSVGTVCLTVGTYLNTVKKHEKQIEDLRNGKSPFDSAMNEKMNTLSQQMGQVLSQGSSQTVRLKDRVEVLERHFEELDRKFDELKAGQVRIETLLQQALKQIVP
jgi:seryl-tRNA synthetase